MTHHDSNLSSQPKILATKPSPGYELIDSGEGEKLERFGAYVLRRPDPQALWRKTLPAERWDLASARFINSGRSGVWKKSAPLAETEVSSEMPESWPIEISGLTFGISLSAFKHTGIFPEQSENWNWIMETIAREKNLKKTEDKNADDKEKNINILNLFGYTGGATLAAAKAGANVTHVDGSKVSVNKARENARLSGLDSKPIRWIVDDAMAFVKRESRRGNRYDGIIMDPPVYGHGPKKELWEIENHLPLLITECQKILSEKPLFVILNGYASGYSAVAYKNNILDLISGKSLNQTPNQASDKISDQTSNQASKESDILAGQIEFGELATESLAGRLLPSGIFARWRR